MLEVAAPRAAGARHEANPARDLDIGQIGIGGDTHPGAVGNESELDGLEVHQERIGADVVAAARLAVELAGIVRGRAEIAAVDDDVAADLAQAARPELVRGLPQALVGELGIAAAADHEVAIEDPGGELAHDQEIGMESERGTEQVERRVRGEQLHQRGRIDQSLGLVGDQRSPAFDGNHDHGRRSARNPGGGERAAHRIGQLASAECQRHQQERGEERAHQANASTMATPAARISANSASSTT